MQIFFCSQKYIVFECIVQLANKAMSKILSVSHVKFPIQRRIGFSFIKSFILVIISTSYGDSESAVVQETKSPGFLDWASFWNDLYIVTSRICPVDNGRNCHVFSLV